MDIKMLMVGILISVVIFIAGTSIILDVGVNNGADVASMNATLGPIYYQQEVIKNDMNDTASAMQGMFTNTSAQQQSTTGWSELDALYKAAGGVARLSINSIGYLFVLFATFTNTFPTLSFYMGIAAVAFMLVLIISIAYLVFFRIPR